MPQPPDPLDALLHQLGQQTPPPTLPLAPTVWRRIAQADAKGRPNFWDRLHAVFARPSFAITFVAACVFLGLFLAEVRRSHREVEYQRELMQSYLRLIDPLLQTAEQAPAKSSSAKS